MLAIIEHALATPALQFSDLPIFRQNLASGLLDYSTAENALYLGAQAATPGMAFLAGYQNAIRCLDRHCPRQQLAAFCVSEKGIKKPWDMTTQLVRENSTYQLNGHKGYVMLLPDELDRLYVLAKDDEGSLRCLYLPATSNGVSATEALEAPFVQDIPHSGVRFENVVISHEQLLDIDGHQQANKPFRYWEDVHVALAMIGWIIRDLTEMGRPLSDLADIVALACELTEEFQQHPAYYSVKGIRLLDSTQQSLDRYGQDLSESAKHHWSKDRLLLQMGQKIRNLVKEKLARQG